MSAEHVIQVEPEALAVSGETERTNKVQAITQDLRVIFKAKQSHSRWVEKQCGVSAAQLWAMWELMTSPGLKVSELSHVLSLHQSTTSNMLDKLEIKGLVKRERGGPDQRVVRLYLTEQGQTILNKAPQPAQGAITHALAKLPDETLAQLESGLGQLLDAMEIADEDGGVQPMSVQTHK